jgi:hypothetical protein
MADYMEKNRSLSRMEKIRAILDWPSIEVSSWLMVKKGDMWGTPISVTS